MARPQARIAEAAGTLTGDHPFPPFPWGTLDRPLRDAERAGLQAALRGLLRFQRALDRFPRVRGAPDATPFVSLYAEGALKGCYGSVEGGPAERLARAFLRAQDDPRFGGVAAAHRAVLAAQVSYPRRARLVSPEAAEEELELGTHGVALVRDRAPATLLLPHVARDEQRGARDLLHGLARKAGLDPDAYRDGALYLFETEDVFTREREHGARPAARADTPERLAASWLASLVAADGSVAFAIDPRGRRRVETGEMHHGRAAVVVQALAAAGGHDAAVARARRRLREDVRAALGGAPPAGWPGDPAAVAGTIALAVLAGVGVKEDLAALAAADAARIARTPWHAAQVVAALGPGAPAALWAACVADLDRRPWAPWTLIAADARGDREVRARAARAVADSLRKDPPHRGGATVTPIPEVALTSIAVEALARHPAPWSRAAAARGRAFVASMQLTGRRLYAALDPSLAEGAFPASPVVDLLRGDVTGHALLALLASPP
jgi:AMMECR1 domain-containing protein